ncbi:MAG: RNA polymerase subunit sigma [Planctomycetota bacterium]|nr:MAG: RNA polymerase subunit sigma [Planctomycetota bacterium]
MLIPVDTRTEATVFLQRMAAGDAAAGAQLLPLVYDELHRLAGRHMAGQGAQHTLQATALVNEAWVRLGLDGGASWNDKTHFMAFASKVMRSVLVDHARRRGRVKRGGDRARVPLEIALDSLLDQSAAVGLDALDLGLALDELQADEPRLAQVVELRFFGGLSMEQAAEVMQVSLSTAERSWRLARVWLREALTGDDHRGS